MAKYHINNQDKVAPCTATKIPCKYRAPEHFSSKEEAEKELDKRLKKKYEAQQVSLKKDLINKNNPNLSSNVITKEEVKTNKLFDVHSDNITKSLNSAPVFIKSSKVSMRIAKPGEKLETVLKDGTVETSRVLDGGEFIVKNPDGEEYAISEEKFNSRYEKISNSDEYAAKGRIKAIKNPTNEDITIMAPWGEEQHGGKNCWIASSIDNPDDRYIIGEKEFDNTYKMDKKSNNKDYETLAKEIEDLRDAKKNASPEEIKKINGQIRGKSIHLSRMKREMDNR